MNGLGAVGDGGAHPVGGVGGASGLNDYVGALANLKRESVRHSDISGPAAAHSKRHNVRLIWVDWHKIIRDDSHRMLVDAELLDTFSTSVNQPQSMRLPGGEMEFGKSSIVRTRRSISNERAIVVHFSVDQIVIRFRCCQREICTHDIFDDRKVRLVIVVRQQYRAEIDVIACVSWAIDYHGSQQTTGVLCAIVRMVP